MLCLQSRILDATSLHAVRLFVCQCQSVRHRFCSWWWAIGLLGRETWCPIRYYTPKTVRCDGRFAGEQRRLTIVLCKAKGKESEATFIIWSDGKGQWATAVPKFWSYWFQRITSPRSGKIPLSPEFVKVPKTHDARALFTHAIIARPSKPSHQPPYHFLLHHQEWGAKDIIWFDSVFSSIGIGHLFIKWKNNLNRAPWRHQQVIPQSLQPLQWV